jgi:hypothetical protein
MAPIPIRGLVGDRRGGYSPGYINLDVGSTAGSAALVADQNGKPVPGASFDVNGRATNATASGRSEPRPFPFKTNMS